MVSEQRFNCKECGYSDTSASKYCPSCGSKMVYGWKSDTIEAAEEALNGCDLPNQ